MTIPRHVDVLIIGAGLSGIGAACHLVRESKGTTYAVLERRTAIGGTWDLFKYPGIRSDSDMFTFGYGFRPWVGTKILADGPSIKKYVEETAAEYGVTDHLHFGRRVVRANFSSADDLWTVECDVDGTTEVWTARFLVGATGYYNYDQGFRPTFPGEESFGGQIIHPQFWPENLDYAGKRVVVIGSGATAITLIPAMAPLAGHITMLQRSPSYIMPIPAEDPVASPLAMIGAPAGAVYKTGRARNIALQRAIYKLCRTQPKLARKVLLGMVRAQLGGKVDMKHFTPSYNPWDERLCVVPNGDLFKVLRRGQAHIVTDHIDTFTETGIRTRSGEELPADIVISATGLQIQIAGGAQLSIDGEPVSTRDRMLYKGVLIEGAPNAMFIIGYTNASWTLKADLASEYFARLVNHMRKHGYTRVVPVAPDGMQAESSVMGDSMRSGYIARGDAVMPRQGRKAPWRIVNNYYIDKKALRGSRIADDALAFSTLEKARADA